jgi:hypothetical protein
VREFQGFHQTNFRVLPQYEDLNLRYCRGAHAKAIPGDVAGRDGDVALREPP